MNSTLHFDQSRPVNIESSSKSPRPIRYVLRDDTAFCSSRCSALQICQLAKYIEEATGLECEVIDVNEQLIWAYDRVEEMKGTSLVVSLDKWFRGDYDLRISRNFGENDDLLGFVHTEVSPLVAMTTDILFVDDDKSSGRTFTFASRLFPRCKFPRFFTLSDYYDGEIFDIVDARDFIPGAIHGGLMFRGERISYLDPRVDLKKRMRFANNEISNIFREKVSNLWK